MDRYVYMTLAEVEVARGCPGQALAVLARGDVSSSAASIRSTSSCSTRSQPLPFPGQQKRAAPMKALTVRAEADRSRLHGRWLLLPASASCSLSPSSASQRFPAPGVGLERGPEAPRQDNRFRTAAGDVLSDIHAASGEARAPAHAGRGEGAPPHSADLSNAAIGEIWTSSFRL